MTEWLVDEIQTLLIAVGRRSNPGPSRVFANSRLISILIALSRAAFLLCSRLCVRSEAAPLCNSCTEALKNFSCQHSYKFWIPTSYVQLAFRILFLSKLSAHVWFKANYVSLSTITRFFCCLYHGTVFLL